MILTWLKELWWVNNNFIKKIILYPSYHIITNSPNKIISQFICILSHEENSYSNRIGLFSSITCGTTKSPFSSMSPWTCHQQNFASSSPKHLLSIVSRAFPIISANFRKTGLRFTKSLEWDQISFSQKIVFAIDGTANVSGSYNSLNTRLEIKILNVFQIKCVCHSAHLVALNASSALRSSAENCNHKVAYYFCHSPRRVRKLLNFQEFLSLNTNWIPKSHTAHCLTH